MKMCFENNEKKNLWDMPDSATLPLSNSHSLTITVDESTDTVDYQYSNEDWVKTADIEYLEDTENVTGYGEETDEEGYPDLQPAFTTGTGVTYFIGQFLRNNFGPSKKDAEDLGYKKQQANMPYWKTDDAKKQRDSDRKIMGSMYD